MPNYPALYQVNIRVVLTALAETLGRPATFDDVPDEMIADWAGKGFEWVWLLSVWQTGPAARTISRNDAVLRTELQHALPDLVDSDIGGSGFSIREYAASRELGGDSSLAQLRERMRSHGLKLMLDFVPNHVAPDHRWVDECPDYFVLGSPEDLARQPHNYRRVATSKGEKIIALGRDPNFAGWADTLQLNYGNLALQQAMLEELQSVSQSCDGVRCDMAMLILPSVFCKTWGIESQSFWPNAIRKVRESFPEFMFMAEVYWDLEWELQQQGFSYCYDKRLYDRLRSGHAGPVRMHLVAGLDYQNRLARFLENHDEARAVEAFPFGKHCAAALLTYLTPGIRFFHQGQLEGYRKRVSPHVVRAPKEETDFLIERFYSELLMLLRQPILKEGEWRLLEAKPIADGNRSNESIIAFQWKHLDGSLLLVAVNYCDSVGRAKIEMIGEVGPDTEVHFERFSNPGPDFNGNRPANELSVEMPPWSLRVVSFRR